MRGFSPLAALALGAAMATPDRRVFGAENIERMLSRYGRSRQVGNSIAERNRHTGEPHENRREVARRQRQAERNRKNQLARAEQEGMRNGLGRSRRWRLVDCAP